PAGPRRRRGLRRTVARRLRDHLPSDGRECPMKSRVMLSAICLVALAAAPSGQQAAAPGRPAAALAYKDLDSLFHSLPPAAPPALDQPQALFLATMPLSCLDRPQAHPPSRGYLWDATYRPVDDYQKNLAFYGCFDWHSSVNSIWTLVRLVKSFPDLAVAPIIR